MTMHFMIFMIVVSTENREMITLKIRASFMESEPTRSANEVPEHLRANDGIT
jgi:hypothetical protein